MSIPDQLADSLTSSLKRIKTNLVHKLDKMPNFKKILFICLPLVLILGLISQARCAVVLGDQVVAVAADRQAAQSVVEGYLSRLEKDSGMPVKVLEEIKYKPTWKFWAEANDEQMQNKLAAQVQYNFQATGIYVDGKRIAVVKNAALADQVLDELLSTYNNGGVWQASFKQKVTKKPVEVADHELMQPEEALERIRFGGNKARYYEVKAGDTLWDVAVAARVPVEQLLLSNPDLNPERMQIGQQISISQSCPLVDVISGYQATCREEIPYQVQEKVDGNLYLGERKLVQKGKPGEREVTYDIALENGVEVQRKVVEQKTITKPKHQVIAKGERKLLASRGGNGRLAYPTVGGTTSGYGNRNGRFHSGVDLAASYGSPVVAAESGTVIRAGYRGAYGLCVDISHGGGVVTRYAHLSSLAVKSGQRVERSQFIGRAGSTGNSTGPHLHFEVMVNGVHKNPSLFI